MKREQKSPFSPKGILILIAFLTCCSSQDSLAESVKADTKTEYQIEPLIESLNKFSEGDSIPQGKYLLSDYASYTGDLLTPVVSYSGNRDLLPSDVSVKTSESQFLDPYSKNPEFQVIIKVSEDAFIGIQDNEACLVFPLDPIKTQLGHCIKIDETDPRFELYKTIVYEGTETKDYYSAVVVFFTYNKAAKNYLLIFPKKQSNLPKSLLFIGGYIEMHSNQSSVVLQAHSTINSNSMTLKMDFSNNSSIFKKITLSDDEQNNDI